MRPLDLGIDPCDPIHPIPTIRRIRILPSMHHDVRSHVRSTLWVTAGLMVRVPATFFGGRELYLSVYPDSSLLRRLEDAQRGVGG